MAVNKKIEYELIEIEGELTNTVSYAEYYNRIPLFTSIKIFNRGKENAAGITVGISSSSPLLLSSEISIEEVPHESSVEINPENIINPKYLADLSQPEVSVVTVTVAAGKNLICKTDVEITALPFDYWSGLSGNLEMLAAYVRPKVADCMKILAEAGLQLRTWGYSSEFTGYAGNDKNGVRNAVASVYSAIRRQNVEREEMGDITGISPIGSLASLGDKKFTPLAMALFAASCFEAAKLNSIVLLGKNKIGVGVWLAESCFSSTVQDDMSIVEKYISDGVNNLTIIDVDDLFAHRNASYATSEMHASSGVSKNSFEALVDIRRCRIGGIFPTPLKVKTGAGYELLGEGQFSFDAKPEKVTDFTKYDYDRQVSKDINWQRRLLDLSQKNNLLNFRYKGDCLHILAADIEPFCNKLEGVSKFSVLPNVNEIQNKPFGLNRASAAMSELISIELSSGKIRCMSTAENILEVSTNLIRKARSVQEETGTNTLYLAFGFLGWKHEGDKEMKYAPICLLPVTIKKLKNQGLNIELGDEYVVNTTLLEFLKQEFSVDVRGVEGKGLSPKELLAIFRAKTVNMKDWTVYEDIYISQFTFTRYAMWADVKNNIDKYKSNALISSLLTNTNKLKDNKLVAKSEDESSPDEVLLPLACDGAQYEAVAESAKGTTFVLHGPPGTGKSQTITNMIANALSQNKRVLFVAEKQAALQVVKKRLTEIGISEFCLELHSGKSADKAEIVRGIENTLSLAADYDSDKFKADVKNIVEMRDSLLRPLKALHKKRRLGVSVYEGIVYYLQNKDAPELMNIESTFYDTLTKQRLSDCENMLTVAQAAANGCGGVYRSPFFDVNLTECGKKTLTSVLCSAEVVLAELKHLKNYLGIFLETFNQKITKFTPKKLSNMLEIANILLDGSLSDFFDCDEEQFYQFYNASLRYDSETKHWLKYFKKLPDLGKLADEIEREIDNWGENYRSSRVLLNVLKRINACSREPIKQKDELEWIKRAYEIEQARNKILTCTELSAAFNGFGGFNERRRTEFMQPLYHFHSLCFQTFMDYNADAFNSVCIESSGGILSPLVFGFIAAANSFKKSSEQFIKVIRADITRYQDDDIFDFFTKKCTAIIDNIDMLPSWCMYKSTAQKLGEMGLTFITDAMESGKISGTQILSSFRKNVYRNFIQTNIPADEDLAVFSASVLDETASNFSRLLEEFNRLTRDKIRAELISRLPAKETEGRLALELVTFQRQIKGNMRGLNLRSLFLEIPELMKVVAPCMLMSPITVSQYLPAESQLFDLVIFDEASQIPTCEAVPSLARAKSAIIVGDPKQMPPTSFFTSIGQDDDHPEAEDLDSVLDDCLALGIPERHLLWHYRSKHESLIAFSNSSYYSSKLCTFPSPDALDSRVKLCYIENGVYERGGTKCNKLEAEELIKEVISRLKDERKRKQSLGIVTFSTPQQVYIERLLSKEIQKNNLEEVAYEREEPLFVKNLENVQGDERDVILFSVCYGPDSLGRLSLNFGPLNQYGGWRRLNVAVSRAREEMLVFTSMRYSVIDLSRTTSRGVAGLKAFLEYAEKGRTSVAVRNDELILNKQSIGKYVAEELNAYGYDCRCNVGVSDFKIDVAVIDPKNKHKFILAILCDGETKFSAKDRSVMQIQTLKRNNWNVLRLYSINFFNNPKREIKRIKDYLDKLTSGKSVVTNFKKPYKLAKITENNQDPNYILSGENDGEVTRVIKNIVSVEEPISLQLLMKRTLSAFGISKYGVKLESKLRALIEKCDFGKSEMLGNSYFFKNDKFGNFDKYRVEEGTQLRTTDTDYTPYDIISLIKSILLSRVSVYIDELIPVVMKELKVPRSTDKITSLIYACIDEGVARAIFIRSVSDKISLA